MALYATRRAFAFCVTGCLSSGLCQTTDPALYEQFFRQVAALTSLSDRGVNTVGANREVVKPTVPKIQDVTGLTDTEVEILSATASDCVSTLDSFQATARSLTFESRLQFAESGRHSDAITQRLRDLDDRRNKVILTHVQQLKAALLTSGFVKVDAYIHAPSDTKRSLIPSFEPRPASSSRKK